MKTVRGNPYAAIEQVIERWCRKNYYCDMLVTILIDGEKRTELLLFSANDGFEWLNDWFEGGTKTVVFLGFFPVCKADASGSILKEPVGIITVDGSYGGDE